MICFGYMFQVLELESINVKVLYRRVQVYMELVDLDLVEFDVKKVFEVDFDNRFVFFYILSECYSKVKI